jgi:NADPH:quinone reductase
MLGPTGLSAYFGALDVGRLNEGETVLVSGAAGGVGTFPAGPVRRFTTRPGSRVSVLSGRLAI